MGFSSQAFIKYPLTKERHGVFYCSGLKTTWSSVIEYQNNAVFSPKSFLIRRRVVE